MTSGRADRWIHSRACSSSPRFGRDLGDIRLHTGPAATQAAAAIHAKAFTASPNIAIATSPVVQRQPVGYSSVGVYPVAASTADTVASRRSGGVPLPVATRRFFEPRFGVDLGAVRVHA